MLTAAHKKLCLKMTQVVRAGPGGRKRLGGLLENLPTPRPHCPVRSPGGRPAPMVTLPSPLGICSYYLKREDLIHFCPLRSFIGLPKCANSNCPLPLVALMTHYLRIITTTNYCCGAPKLPQRSVDVFGVPQGARSLVKWRQILLSECEDQILWRDCGHLGRSNRSDVDTVTNMGVQNETFLVSPN